MNEDALIGALVHAWLLDVAPHVRRDCCILGARVASGVLDHWGIAHDVVPCGLTIYNNAALAAIDAGTPPPLWPSDAWSIGTHPVGEAAGYAGHVVVRTDQGTIIDLSAAQFNRAGRIDVAGPRVWNRTEWVARDDGGFYVREDSHALLWVFFPTSDVSYRRAPDWRKATRTVGRVIRTIHATERI